jgi:hypothetical protein
VKPRVSHETPVQPHFGDAHRSLLEGHPVAFFALLQRRFGRDALREVHRDGQEHRRLGLLGSLKGDVHRIVAPVPALVAHRHPELAAAPLAQGFEEPAQGGDALLGQEEDRGLPLQLRGSVSQVAQQPPVGQDDA